MKNKLEKEINTKELNDVIGLSKKILKILYFVFIACLILASIIAIQKLNILNILLDFLSVISPFFIGFVLAWYLRPLALKLSELVGLLPSWMESITKGITNFFVKFEENGLNLGDFPEKLLANITSFGMDIAKNLPNTIISFVVALFSGIGTFAMGLIIGIYMLIDYDNIADHFKKLFPKKFANDIHHLATRMSGEVRKCVNGTFLVALMVLICDSVGFALVGLNAPILFGLFCGITDLIPFIGPYIGGAVAVIVGLTQDPLIGIGTLIICVIVQIVENYILQPIVMSRASSIHPVIIIIALLVFGHFFGILGMVLATPILTILRVLLEFTNEKLKIFD